MTRRQFRRTTRSMKRQTKRQWRHLSSAQRVGIIAGAVVQISLLAAAQYDLSRRSDDEVRGPKLFWRLFALVNFVGPLTYFAFGRRAAEPTSTSGGEESARSEVSAAS